MITADVSNPPAALSPDLKQSADFIAAIQHKDGAIPWYGGGKLDPWDHTEAAMALSVAGHWREAEQAYLWLAQQQLTDGSWYAHYLLGEASDALRETNFVAYIATGVWHHYLVTGSRSFLADLFPCVELAIDFVLQQQSTHGEIAWAVGPDGVAEDDALVTACASVLRSIDCAIRAADILGHKRNHWLAASSRLRDALINKPLRFDRTWESKARFSMDWYYPVLAGLYDNEQAHVRLQSRWHEFVVPGLGCRCVSDEPWVTMAETSELVMALVAANQRQTALGLFATLRQWRDVDGGYWTGYVFRDDAIWPEEKTTWTAGAVILAADSLFRISGGAEIFSTPLICNK